MFGVFLPPLQGLEILWTVDPGRRSHARFALGYYLSGFQPFCIRVNSCNSCHPMLNRRLSASISGSVLCVSASLR